MELLRKSSIAASCFSGASDRLQQDTSVVHLATSQQDIAGPAAQACTHGIRSLTYCGLKSGGAFKTKWTSMPWLLTCNQALAAGTQEAKLETVESRLASAMNLGSLGIKQYNGTFSSGCLN